MTARRPSHIFKWNNAPLWQMNLLWMTCSGASSTKFTNFQCEVLDSSFCTFDECKLKVITRGLVGVNMRLRFFELPVSNVSLKMGLYKKAGSYKPFFYNTSANFCRFVKDTSMNFFMKFIFNFITEYSNINHSCPYDHDVIIKDMIAPEEKFRLLPIPIGEYMLRIIIIINKKERVAVNTYIHRYESYKH
ncbi:uncharacterized protein LOC142235889 [Haematobia irritans]|uniref:uncharacterized protein LOC142235889 n=1 Tax=Haematobia irritans TaxID=7368 RepID=UPI003F4FD68A